MQLQGLVGRFVLHRILFGFRTNMELLILCYVSAVCALYLVSYQYANDAHYYTDKERIQVYFPDR